MTSCTRAACAARAKDDSGRVQTAVPRSQARVAPEARAPRAHRPPTGRRDHQGSGLPARPSSRASDLHTIPGIAPDDPLVRLRSPTMVRHARPCTTWGLLDPPSLQELYSSRLYPVFGSIGLGL